MNFGFIIDNRKCIGCHACTVACKAEHDVPIGVNRTWVKYVEKGEFPNTRRLFSVMRCNHCDDAPCVEICPVTALYKRDDGIVDFDNRRCIGCKACTQACPYDALYIDPSTHTAAKCNYCAHRVDIGLEPACVNVCPEHAIISGDMDNPTSEIARLLAREQVTTRKAEKGTKPQLFYIEGDESSLEPAATAPSNAYMWNSQTSGVGHFARYAESRLSQVDMAQMANDLAGRKVREGEWVSGGEGTMATGEQVLVPSGTDHKKMYQKALDVLREGTRRVYDAPNKGVVWGWEVAAYVWTKAIATGVLLVPFLALTFGFANVSEQQQWLGLGLGLLFLLITGVLLIKDLDKPLRFAYVLLRPQWRSWLVRGGYAITIYGALLTLWGVTKALKWASGQSIALWGSAIFAILTAVYTAFLFAQAKGRDFWQSPTLPLHMLTHAILAGAAVFGIVALVTTGGFEWATYVRNLMLIGIVANLVIIATELLTPHPTADAKTVVKMILTGQFSRRFWLGVLLAGNAVPFALLVSGSPAFVALAGMLVLIGIYLTEHIWIRAPQLLPLS